jgi:MYXO-CTERM domain-containing protein
MCGDMEFMQCNAPVRLELADGRMYWVRAGVNATTCQGGQPAAIGLSSLPAAEIAWAREEAGEGTRVIDNTAAIAAAISTYNNRYFADEQMRWPIPSGTAGSFGAGGAAGSGPGSGGAVGSGGSSGGSGPGGIGGPGTAGIDGLSGAAGANGGPGLQQRGGCGCATAGLDAGSGLAALLLAGAAGLSVGRRRRRGQRLMRSSASAMTTGAAPDPVMRSTRGGERVPTP